MDAAAQRVDINVSAVNNLGTSGGGQSVCYDAHTQVTVDGRSERAADLERGDRIFVRGRNVDGHYLADTITAMRNGRTGA